MSSKFGNRAFSRQDGPLFFFKSFTVPFYISHFQVHVYHNNASMNVVLHPYYIFYHCYVFTFILYIRKLNPHICACICCTTNRTQALKRLSPQILRCLFWLTWTGLDEKSSTDFNIFLLLLWFSGAILKFLSI